MTYCDNCCVGHYDACCDSCCPCIPNDKRDIILNCCACFLVVTVLATFVFLLAGFSVVRHATVTVEDASLTSFAVATSPATTLTYNLSLTLKVHNPNWVMGMKYTQPLSADFSFNSERFGHSKLADKGQYQPAGKNLVYYLASGGVNEFVPMGSGTIDQFQQQNASGAFQLEVALAGEVRYALHSTKCKVTATCAFKVQLSPPGTPSSVFQTVKCKME